MTMDTVVYANRENAGERIAFGKSLRLSACAAVQMFIGRRPRRQEAVASRLEVLPRLLQAPILPWASSPAQRRQICHLVTLSSTLPCFSLTSSSPTASASPPLPYFRPLSAARLTDPAATNRTQRTSRVRPAGTGGTTRRHVGTRGLSGRIRTWARTAGRSSRTTLSVRSRVARRRWIIADY